MLSIGKLGQGQGDYYIDSVASGIEDYYTGTGEAPGRWTGTSAGRLGLHGEVDAAQLRALLEGDHPTAGGQLVTVQRGPRRRVPGFDLTFSAPKSVSLAFGLGNPELSREVRDAHEAAVDAALGYMERHAAVGRRGRGGAQIVLGEGFVAAAFRHRSSRAGDPQLHTHVLVANAVKGPDGRWTALDGRRLYVQAKTAGYLYQAHLRAELTRRLGVEWTAVRRGQAEIAGVPPTVLRAFSRRRAELEAQMEQRGERSAKAAQVATLDTRQAKDYSVPAQTLHSEWMDRAQTLGFPTDRLDELTHRAEPHPLNPTTAAATKTELLGPNGLTQRRSTFGRREVLQAWAEQLQEGADVEVVERLADDLLDDPDAIALAQDVRDLTTSDVIRRNDGRVVPATAEERRYSTAELLAREREILATAEAGPADLGQVSTERADAVLTTRRTLSPEQAAMVRALLTEGDAVSVVVGKAGTGKTFALDAARDGWQQEGLNVVGVALARRAARELEDGAGIPSTSVSALLNELRELGPTAVLGQRQSVLVVDEAGMVGTRQMHELITAAREAQTKVVLVGDHHQLPEIDAGGAFRGLVQRGQPIELTDNRRQRHAWERDALDLLREGHSAEALARYQDHDRVVVGDDAPAVRTQLVNDWWQARQTTHEAVMIALRRDDVADLNACARVVMLVAGRLGSDALTVAGREFAVGDEVICLRNDPRLGVLNGTRGRITGLDLDRHELTLETDDGEPRTLPETYLAGKTERGGLALDYAYAITGHKAQGMTTERTFVLGSDALYREWGYVAMSRGREANRLYIVGPGASDREEIAPTQPRGDERAALATALARSQAQPLAHDAEAADHLSTMPTADLRALVGQPAAPAQSARTVERLESELGRAGDALQKAQRHREALERAANGQPAPRDLTQARAAEDQSRERHARLLAAHERARASQPPGAASGSSKTRLARAELARREDLAIRRALAAPPRHLEAGLGVRPEAPVARREWERAAARLERYRFRHDVRDPERVLGVEPVELRERAAWRDARRDLDRSRAELSREPGRPHERAHGREFG